MKKRHLSVRTLGMKCVNLFTPLGCVLLLAPVIVACSSREEPAPETTGAGETTTKAPTTSQEESEEASSKAAEAPSSTDARAASATPDAAASEPSEPVDLLHALPVELVASTAYRANTKQIQRMVDGDMETAWNSESGDLEGAWIAFRIPENASVSSIEMTSGFIKRSESQDLFTGNYRVNRVLVTRDDEQLGEYPLTTESRELQRIPVSGGGGLYRIVLIGMHPGSHESWREACISELKVLGNAPNATAGSSTPTARIATAQERTTVSSQLGGEDTPADGGAEPDALGEASDEEGSSWTPAVMQEADGLRVTELAVAIGVENASPIDPRRTFSKASDERVYCFMRLANPGSQATKITLSWEQPGAAAPSRRREVDVPPRPRFGTYAYITTGHRSGRWECVIRSAEENLLGRIDFEITD